MLHLTVKKTPYEMEWVARVTDNGKVIDSYFAFDREDAETTGKQMLADAQYVQQLAERMRDQRDRFAEYARMA